MAGRDVTSENPDVGPSESSLVDRDWVLFAGSVSRSGLWARLVIEAWMFQVMALAVRMSMRLWASARRTLWRLIWMEARSSGKMMSTKGSGSETGMAP